MRTDTCQACVGGCAVCYLLVQTQRRHLLLSSCAVINTSLLPAHLLPNADLQQSVVAAVLAELCCQWPLDLVCGPPELCRQCAEGSLTYPGKKGYSTLQATSQNQQASWRMLAAPDSTISENLAWILAGLCTCCMSDHMPWLALPRHCGTQTHGYIFCRQSQTGQKPSWQRQPAQAGVGFHKIFDKLQSTLGQAHAESRPPPPGCSRSPAAHRTALPVAGAHPRSFA